MVEDYQAVLVLKVLVQAHATMAAPQQAGQRRLASLERLPSQGDAVELQQVEGIQEDVVARGLRRNKSNTAKPLLSQTTASASIRQDCTFRWFTASTMSG